MIVPKSQKQTNNDELVKCWKQKEFNAKSKRTTTTTIYRLRRGSMGHILQNCIAIEGKNSNVFMTDFLCSTLTLSCLCGTTCSLHDQLTFGFFVFSVGSSWGTKMSVPVEPSGIPPVLLLTLMSFGSGKALDSVTPFWLVWSFVNIELIKSIFTVADSSSCP